MMHKDNVLFFFTRIQTGVQKLGAFFRKDIISSERLGLYHFAFKRYQNVEANLVFALNTERTPGSPLGKKPFHC